MKQIERKCEKEIEIQEKVLRGKRIKYIREKELKLNKTELGKKLDLAPQFLGLVEDGKGNLVYNSLKRLSLISGHSIDYILFGVDDNVIKETKEILKEFSHEEILQSINIIKSLVTILKNSN